MVSGPGAGAGSPPDEPAPKGAVPAEAGAVGAPDGPGAQDEPAGPGAGDESAGPARTGPDGADGPGRPGGPDAAGGPDTGDAPGAAGGGTDEAGRAGLSDRDQAVLGLARRTWQQPGAKERAIREHLGMSPTRYYQLLNALLDNPAALARDPVTVNRLRRMRDARRRRR